jgi:hypothetical protein
LVLTAFLGLNSLTGNEPNTSITTSSSQLSNNQDLPAVVTPTAPEGAPVVKQIINKSKTITTSEFADHMALSVTQLETVALMLSILEQTDGGPTPTE